MKLPTVSAPIFLITRQITHAPLIKVLLYLSFLIYSLKHKINSKLFSIDFVRLLSVGSAVHDNPLIIK